MPLRGAARENRGLVADLERSRGKVLGDLEELRGLVVLERPVGYGLEKGAVGNTAITAYRVKAAVES